MSHAISNHLAAIVLSEAIAAILALLWIFYRALQRTTWPAQKRARVFSTVALVISAWFFSNVVFSQLGLFRGTRSGVPTIQYGLLIPILAGIVLFWAWPALRRIIEVVPQQWIVALQFYRAVGVVFVVLYAVGRLPGLFAEPAGWGDISVGLLAPVVAIAYARRLRGSIAFLRTWNLLGITDLVVAVTTGFLSSPSRFQRWALNDPNTLISAFPLVVIPVFLVPIAFLLHFASLQKLGREELGSRVGQMHPSGARGWISNWKTKIQSGSQL